MARGLAYIHCDGYHWDNNWQDACSGMNMDINTVDIPTTTSKARKVEVVYTMRIVDEKRKFLQFQMKVEGLKITSFLKAKTPLKTSIFGA